MRGRGHLRLGALIGLCAAAVACAERSGTASRAVASPAEPTAEQPAEPAADPAAAMADLEARLRRAKRVRVVFEITSEGVNPSKLRGHLMMAPDGSVRLEAGGSFFGAATQMELTANAERVSGRAGDKQLDVPRPPDLHGALVIGLTRMGLLHNLAMLHAGRPPDHADGTVEDWVTLSDVGGGETSTIAGVESRPLHFGIHVDGTPVGEATLWRRSRDDLPLRREQRVKFPDGEMTVVEHYEIFEVGG